MKITERFIFIDEASCKEVARIDLAKGQVSTLSTYVEDNALAYFVLINTWANLVSELSPENSYNLVGAIKMDGLIKTIHKCQGFSDDIIESLDCGTNTVPIEALFMLQGCESIVHALALLRFPKRFSPLRANLVASDSITNFLSVNNEMKQKQHYELNRFVIDRVKPIVHEMLRGFEWDPSEGYFSAGAFVGRTQNMSNTLYNKVESWAEPNWFHPMYPNSAGERSFDRPFYTAELKAVPKSYKAARIIAKEDSYRQWHMQAIRSAIENCIANNGFCCVFDVKQQEQNRLKCFMGSMDGTYSTADLSSASDRISCSLMRELLPHDVLKATDEYRSRYFSVRAPKGVKVYTTQMYNTSGAALTFVLEGIVFSAIAIGATRLVELMLGEQLAQPCIFGDDILIDPRAYDLDREWLTQLGLVMNESKSYTNPGRYRESCGVEFCDGIELTQSYFPRTTLNFKRNKPEAIQALIALEKRLYDHWAPRTFLIEVVRNLLPSMTSSHPLSENEDLWEPYPLFGERELISGNSLTVREQHSRLMTTYPSLKPSDRQCERLNMFYYMQYLVNGPLYLDGLDRTLRVSTSRRNYKRDLQQPNMGWSLRW